MRKHTGRKIFVGATVVAGLLGALGVAQATAAPQVPTAGSFVNGDFEAGTLDGWTLSGTTSAQTPGRSGIWAAQLGATGATKGQSEMEQTFTAPAGATKLSVWYLVTCNGRVNGDYFTASLNDLSASGNGSVTMVPKTCTKDYTWTEVVVPVIEGHVYTLTLTNRDDNKAATATYTQIDDITLS